MSLDVNNLVESVETAIVSAIEADDWLGDADNVTTVQRGLQEQLFPDQGARKALRPSQLPAIRVIIEDPKTTTQFTTREIENYLDVTCITINRHKDLETGRRNSCEITGRLERLLEKQKDSSCSIAVDITGYIGQNVRTERSVRYEPGVGFYTWWAETTCTVHVITNYED